ncbi:hypothetical protein [Kordia jejudonensis]|uniref:hypothetical protein n=1 Tax=Kordia jejudonensis TaxID=1348245 RepID=UPI0006290A59|nr:hypothetical protein [Kordia jejudonensis]
MKKAKMKLELNKRNISRLKLDALKGGVTGTTCEFTNRYFKTCQANCPTFDPNCIGSQSICPVTTC